MGALPKRKISTHRKGRRRQAIKLASNGTIKCKSCGELRLPHVSCPNCGAY